MSPTLLGDRFIDRFNGLGLTQTINQPTYEKGAVLDFLFCNMIGVVENLVVLGKNEICSSDHFGITFNAKMKFKMQT